jgi:hypothetical protein
VTGFLFSGDEAHLRILYVERHKLLESKRNGSLDADGRYHLGTVNREIDRIEALEAALMSKATLVVELDALE